MLPAFTIAVLPILGVGYVAMLLASSMLAPRACSGMAAGGGLAIALYLVAVQAGRIFIGTRSFARVMGWLALAHLVVWVGAAVLLAGLHVHPVGFVCGVALLPTAIVSTLVRCALRKEL